MAERIDQIPQDPESVSYGGFKAALAEEKGLFEDVNRLTRKRTPLTREERRALEGFESRLDAVQEKRRKAYEDWLRSFDHLDAA